MFYLGAGNPIAKIGLSYFTPYYLLTFRFLGAFSVFILISYKEILNVFSFKKLVSSLLVSVFTAVSFITTIIALNYTTAINVGFILSIGIVFVPFLSFFILRSKINKSMFFPIILVVLGLFFFCNVGGFITLGKGEMLAFIGAISGACMLVLASKYLKVISPLFISTIQTGFTGFSCLFLALIFEKFPILTDIPTVAWTTIAYMAIFCTCIAYVIQNIALKNIPAIIVALLCTTEPIFTVFTSYFILGEKLSFSGYIGAFLMIIGIILASKITSTENF